MRIITEDQFIIYPFPCFSSSPGCEDHHRGSASGGREAAFPSGQGSNPEDINDRSADIKGLVNLRVAGTAIGDILKYEYIIQSWNFTKVYGG